MRRHLLFALFLALLATSHGWSQATITTYAGSGTAGFSGDNGPAVQASVNRVVALAIDAAGNLYAAEELNNRVRKMDPKGVITTLVGTGTVGFRAITLPERRLRSTRRWEYASTRQATSM